ncbi:hypothetical protein BJV78DRAFT_1353362 [Lactifluus subvellereus]|nr:hypothetical protein BJV78DRAFT_1353362 [Lactifluus subvellereus]
MPLFRKRDRQNGAGRDQGNETSQRPGNISWSNSAVQGVNPSQGGLSPQGNFTQHVLPDNVAVAGGFMQPSSPTSPTRGTQQDGSAHPGDVMPGFLLWTKMVMDNCPPGNCDLDGSGGIGFQEFEPLWNYMTQWRQMFDSFDTDHDGRIDAGELGRALSYYDLHVGPTGIDMLVKKYGTTTPQNRHRHDRIPPRPFMACMTSAALGRLDKRR